VKKCSCQPGKARYVAGVCSICLGLISAAPAQAAPQPQPRPQPTSAVAIMPTAKVAAVSDHPEQPHTPELAEVELAAQETETIERHVLVADHPVYGQLNGLNYLGYCDTCPAAAWQASCSGPCPAA
jgi:hypothetical protein